MKWHCYTSAYESVYSATVEAGDAGRAAEIAAEQEGVGGLWTVIALTDERGIARVKVEERRGYEALSVEAGPD